MIVTPNASFRGALSGRTRLTLLCAMLAGFCDAACEAAVHQWTGLNGTFWSDETNWEPAKAPRFNGRFGDAILVNGSSELVYDSSLGETVFGSNTEAGLRIGAGAVREPGLFTITGGRFLSVSGSAAPDVIGEHGGLFVIKGGAYESGPAGLVVGAVAGKPAKFELEGGVARVPRMLVHLPAGTVSLKGGVLETGGITLAGAAPLKTEPRPVKLNGGVIRTVGDVASVFTVPAGMTSAAEILAGGVTFDTGAGKVVVRESLAHGAGPGEADQDGGLVKEGDGDLYLVAPSSFNGDITINGGSVRVTKGRNVFNPSETPLGNAQYARRNIYINKGGVLCLSANDVLGSMTSDVKTVITVNAGGMLANQHRLLNHAYGMVNRLGPLQLNGGTLHTEGGANARFQSFSFGGPVKVGGSTPSHITASAAAQAKHLGYHLGAATVFDVNDVSRSAATDLFMQGTLIDQPPSGSKDLLPGGLMKQGAGTLRLGAANLHTGVTGVKNGILELEHSLALQFSRLELQAPGRAVLAGQGRTYWLGGLGSRAGVAADIVANGNRVALSSGAVSEFTLGAAAGTTELVRVEGGELALDGQLVVRFTARLTVGTHVFRLLGASGLSGTFRELSVTGSYVVEGEFGAPIVDAAGNSFVFDPARGELTVQIKG